jgi:O-antigen/teichoic acid export membrane protein
VNRLVFSNQPISAITELMTRIGRLQYLIISLVLFGFIVFGKAFLGFWVGEGYEEAYPVALMTMIPMVIPLIQNVAFTAIVAMNKHRFRSNLYLILAVANVAATYFAIPYFGIVGAAMCTFVVFLLGHGIAMNWFYYKKIGINIFLFWKNILRMTVVPCLLILAGLLGQQYMWSIGNIFDFAFGVIGYTIIFCVLSWEFSMNAYEKELTKSMLRKCLPKRK